MTLVFRAIWQDARESLITAAEEAFNRWLTAQAIDIDPPDEGRVVVDHGSTTATSDQVEIRVRRALRDGIDAVQLELTTASEDHARTSLTRLTAIEIDDSDGWLWIDVEREARPGTGWPLLSAPTLIHDLLDNGVDARVDQVRITSTPQRIAPAGLAGLIRNPFRSIPLVVFSEGPAGFTASLARAEETARRLAGAVQTVLLAKTDADAFDEHIGGELGVTGGDARLYLANTGESGLDPDRHRLIRDAQMSVGPTQTVRLVSSILGATITARRPPATYDAVRRELRLGRSRSDAELLAVAESEIERLTAERNQLKSDREYLEETLLDTQADLESAVIETARLQNQLQVMATARNGVATETTSDLAREAHSVGEAISAARDLLSRVVIPEGVEHDIDDLDSNVSSTSWGELVWRGLRALHRYACADHDGDFRHWCATSGDIWAWPATGKKLALRESETVESNRRYADQRRFPVDVDVDQSGTITMWSHLKISEGGGPMAPRIYFHDDTRGTTGKVHVGFIGPHKYTENTRTN